MARRMPAANSGPADGTHGPPPPSTLAAQIVQNQTTTANETATFAQLLNEILHNRAAVQETDVNVNVQLVGVVIEAGLAPLALDNPFAQWDVLIPQAVDSIAVIESTVRRQPEILLARTGDDGPQLSLTLLSRLLAVCGRPKCQDLAVARVLDSLIAGLEASSNLWKAAETLKDVCRSCVDDAIASLENRSTPNASFSFSLPPARSMSQLWPESGTAIALPQGCQTNITSRSHAFMLTLELSKMSTLSNVWRHETLIRLQRLVFTLQSKLDATEQWQRAVDLLLNCSDSLPFLQDLLHKMATIPGSSNQQNAISVSMAGMLQRNDYMEINFLLPAVQTLASDDAFNTLDDRLKLVLAAWLCRTLPEEQVPDHVLEFQNTFGKDSAVVDLDLEEFREQFKSPDRPSNLPLRKRRKLDEYDDDLGPPDAVLTSQITKLLAKAEFEDLSNFPDAAESMYSSLTTKEQQRGWQLLEEYAEIEPELTFQTVTKLFRQLDSRTDKTVRVLSMVTLKATMQQFTRSPTLDLSNSQLGEACLGSLHSSLRELRIAAGQTLLAFLRDDLPEPVKTENRRIALEYLRALSDRDVASEHETLIAAWGQVALVCGEREMNLVLLRMVEYLGHSNSFVCALAFAELEKIATTRGVTIEEVCRPFWSTIAVAVVQDIHSRPQKIQQLCDMLGTDINKFLLLTQQHTIPTFVLTKKKDILQRIASARGSNTSIQDLCLQPPSNLAATLALLLTQSVANPEKSAMECLTAVAPEFDGTDLATLVKLDPVLTACEMLKRSGDTSSDRKSRAYRAFQMFTNLSERRPGQSKGHTKANRALAEFFEGQILGIVARFTDVLENAQAVHTPSEKIGCLHAISDMLALTKSQASIALPQLRACLQSSMEQAELVEAAFSTWLVLLSVLETEDLAHTLDQTFALITRHWTDFSNELQMATHEHVAQLIKSHNQLIQENIMTLPSLKGLTILSKFAAEIDRLRSSESVEAHCKAFGKRLRDENMIVILQALKDLVPFLEKNQDFIHDSAISEQPPAVLSSLLRALLDVTTRYASENTEVADLCGKALGIIGCLDPNRIEATRRKRQVLVLSNFDKANETIEWVAAFFEDVLVKAFKSVTNARAQGFLAYVMQELLRFCNFNEGTVLRARSSQAPTGHQIWAKMPEHIRITLTPFLSSRYLITSSAQNKAPNRQYPSFSSTESHSAWLRFLVYDLMWKAKGDNAKMVFPLIARIVRAHDLAIPSFMLPYAILNVVLGGTVSEVKGISNELLAVLTAQPSDPVEYATIRQCSESVFSGLDYMSTWLQEKKNSLGEARAGAYKTGHSPNDFNESKDMGQIETVEKFLQSVPAEAIANRAMECGSFARALFNWEQYIREQRDIIPSARMSTKDGDMYERLQSIYSQIDEPDGLEGIGAHLSFLTEAQQVTQHTKAGRWTAAQAWYEMHLAKESPDTSMQISLLGCLRETGQYAALLRYADSFMTSSAKELDSSAHIASILPFALEALWETGDLEGIKSRLTLLGSNTSSGDFNTSLGQLLAKPWRGEQHSAEDTLVELRRSIAKGLTVTSGSSLHSSHDELKKLHTLYEIEVMETCKKDRLESLVTSFDKRMAALGSYNADKQFVLGVRRAIMRSRTDKFNKVHMGPSWLSTARLARKAGSTHSAYYAVLQAYECGDGSAKLEEARLLWHDGHQRQAIQALEAAVSSGTFENADTIMENSEGTNQVMKQNMLSAKAHLLLAKWLDASGQSQAKDMTTRYQYAARNFQRWEKGHYYLGKHYNKLLEAEKALPKNKQSATLLSGEMTKLVVENLMRSIPFGNKYWHQSIPKVLTLWLDLGMETLAKARGEDQSIYERRVKSLQSVNKQLQKYVERIPAYVFYTALPQIISRITHPHPDVWKHIANILTRIVASHPNQALWSLLAVAKATDRTRVERGTEILNRLKDPRTKQLKGNISNTDLRMMISQGQRLSDGLLQACEAPVEQRASSASLSKDLGFNHKLAPNQLVVPIETTLSANLPSNGDSEKIRHHKAFAQDKITIASFSDDVLVLSSLQRPRKLTLRGSDGKQYGLLCKPKDDLRKDQRLMEFNGIINRALKRNSDSSKRGLYIKTYAVTPLSEESGTIEWVEGIKPMRDILLGLYARKGTRPMYNEIRNTLNEACAGPEHTHLFQTQVLDKFPPVLHQWFTELYSEPDTWFSARVRYARSAAVMSMTGHVLGLGDRHGENILLEESTGGVFHVDFNCLFDKGLTFEKPELVPFRLTHNMVDAMGPYGYEGPFRKSSELTLSLLRQTKDTLMTVLETFLYDPTTDFIGKKKRTTPGVPETPQEILDSVDGKLKGLLRGETVPLSAEGYVDALIREAVSPANLCAMYIGWCAFL